MHSQSWDFGGVWASANMKKREVTFKGLSSDRTFVGDCGTIFVAHHLRHDGRFLLGLSCESGCACHSLVVSSDEQRIEKRNYLGPGAWEAAGASTRGRQVSF